MAEALFCALASKVLEIQGKVLELRNEALTAENETRANELYELARSLGYAAVRISNLTDLALAQAMPDYDSLLQPMDHPSPSLSDDSPTSSDDEESAPPSGCIVV